MADVFDQATRSRIMRSVPGRNTSPELIVRRALHRRGFRYRLHHPQLLGHPDLVFVSRRKVLFVHGCFWHRHSCSNGQSTPATRVAYWSAKFERNQQRDRTVRRTLRKLGWGVMVVWECQLRTSKLANTISSIIYFWKAEYAAPDRRPAERHRGGGEGTRYAPLRLAQSA